MQKSSPVVYSGVLSDLLPEGQGIVVYGKLDKNELFVAQPELGAHDVYCLPPEVSAAIKKATVGRRAVAAKGVT